MLTHVDVCVGAGNQTVHYSNTSNLWRPIAWLHFKDNRSRYKTWLPALAVVIWHSRGKTPILGQKTTTQSRHQIERQNLQQYSWGPSLYNYMKGWYVWLHYILHNSLPGPVKLANEWVPFEYPAIRSLGCWGTAPVNITDKNHTSHGPSGIIMVPITPTPEFIYLQYLGQELSNLALGNLSIIIYHSIKHIATSHY